jgi:general secretion pathway protein D
VLGGVQTPTLRSLDLTTLSSASGLIGGLVGKTLTNSQSLLGKSIPSYAILFQALARNSNTNVRSTPSMLVLDNEEAKWKSGTDVPYKRGVLPTSTTTATSSLTTNIDRKPLLLELNVKPHIMTDDSILLEIKQSAEDLGETDSELGPTWTTRGIETRVLVRDQQTVVISGLMQEREISSVAKVPLLGDVPIIGYLFKYSTKSKKKTNLLVTLTPYIIKDNIDLDTIRERKQREYDEFFGSLHTLDHMKYEPRIDYRRKRGLLEEINRTVKDVEDEAEQRGKLQPPARVESGLVGPKT